MKSLCFMFSLPLCPGLQQSSSYRSEQEGDDLPLRHQGVGGGEDYSGDNSVLLNRLLTFQ